jgi:protein O-GlcNAc transferase
MTDPHALALEALRLHQQGQLAEARERYRAALAARPADAALHNRHGECCLQQGDAEAALTAFTAALAAAPGMAEAANNQGVALRLLGDMPAALAGFERALTLAPEFLDAAFNRAVALLLLGRGDAALAAWEGVVAVLPEEPDALRGRGDALRLLDQPAAALASYEAALARRPGDAVLLLRTALALSALRRFEDAAARCEAATRVAPQNADAWGNLGNALADGGAPDAAIPAFDRALALRPADATLLANRAATLIDLGRLAAADQDLAAALRLAPDDLDTLQGRGVLRLNQRRRPEALADLRRVLALAPGRPRVLGYALLAQQHLCDWAGLGAGWAKLAEGVASGLPLADPFGALASPLSPGLLRRAAELHVAAAFPAPAPLWHGARWRHPRIRLAYLSADLHDHATAQLMAGVFEQHDRSRFEVFALSAGPEDGSALRARLRGAFEHFEDVRALSDAALAAWIAARQIDLLVDLKGHTEGHRFGVLLRRPAPVQAHWLGFPCTTGATAIDYILLDNVLAPPGAEADYTEQVVRLPHSYQPNDRARPIGPTPSRAEAGLPATGFVFCAFHGAFKITPTIFACWLDLLQAVPDSVLWLLAMDPVAERNLRAAAAAAGIVPGRLIFAPHLPGPAHLARQRLAGIFLDTPLCNAHTTASDALWAGLPVLTVPGATLAARVAASLLHALGMADCVLPDQDAYAAKAWHLATDPAALAALKARLAAAREHAPLFDTALITRHVEAAFTTMWDRWQAGLPPAGFAVPA